MDIGREEIVDNAPKVNELALSQEMKIKQLEE